MLTLLLASLTAAAFPHQGRVYDVQGSPVDGPVSLTVDLYNEAASPSPAWSQTLTVQARDGYYSVDLDGEDDVGTALSAVLLADDTLFIATRWNGQSSDRLPLRTLPLAAVGHYVAVVSDGPATCESEGGLRWDPDAARLELCHASNWTAIAGTTPVLALHEGARRWSDGTYAASCLDYRQPEPGKLYAGATGDGVYRIDPTGSAPHDVHCDMSTDGGGWTMCWSESGSEMVRVASDTYAGTFGSDGYRANCRDVSFDEVLYRNHSTGQDAWFSRNSGGEVTMSGTDYATTGSELGRWTGHGVAVTNYDYQVLVCDNGWMWTGLFVSGITGGGNPCWKACNSWCSDTSTHYYRPDGSDTSSYNGLAFRENGHTNVANKLLSMGIR